AIGNNHPNVVFKLDSRHVCLLVAGSSLLSSTPVSLAMFPDLRRRARLCFRHEQRGKMVRRSSVQRHPIPSSRGGLARQFPDDHPKHSHMPGAGAARPNFKVMSTMSRLAVGIPYGNEALAKERVVMQSSGRLRVVAQMPSAPLQIWARANDAELVPEPHRPPTSHARASHAKSGRTSFAKGRAVAARTRRRALPERMES